jgi:hypothetical protein
VTVLAFSAAYVRALSVPSEASVRVGIVRKAYAYLTGAHLRRRPRSRYKEERLTDNARKYAKTILFSELEA